MGEDLASERFEVNYHENNNFHFVYIKASFDMLFGSTHLVHTNEYPKKVILKFRNNDTKLKRSFSHRFTFYKCYNSVKFCSKLLLLLSL